MESAENLQDYAIFSVDTQGQVASWNAGAERISGYYSEEIAGGISRSCSRKKTCARGLTPD